MWKGPLIVIEEISTLLYRLASRNRESVKHHDQLRICEDRDIPLWVRRKRHMVLTDGSQNTPTATGADNDNLQAGVDQLFQATQSPIEQGTTLIPPRIRRSGRKVNRPSRYSDYLTYLYLQMDINTTDTEARPKGEWRRGGKRPFTQGNTGT